MNSLKQRDSRRHLLSFDVLEDRSTPALISVSVLSIQVSFASVEPTITQRSTPIIVVETPVRAVSVHTIAVRETPQTYIPQPGPASGTDVPAIADRRNSTGTTSSQNPRTQIQSSDSSPFAYSVPMNQIANNVANNALAFATDASRTSNIFATPLGDNFSRTTNVGGTAETIRNAFGPGLAPEDVTPNSPNGRTPEQTPGNGTNDESNNQPSNHSGQTPSNPSATPGEEAAAPNGIATASDAEATPEGISVRALSIAIGSAALALGSGAYVVLRTTTEEENASPALATQRPTETVVD